MAKTRIDAIRLCPAILTPYQGRLTQKRYRGCSVSLSKTVFVNLPQSAEAARHPNAWVALPKPIMACVLMGMDDRPANREGVGDG